MPDFKIVISVATSCISCYDQVNVAFIPRVLHTLRKIVALHLRVYKSFVGDRGRYGLSRSAILGLVTLPTIIESPKKPCQGAKVVVQVQHSQITVTHLMPSGLWVGRG